MDLFVIILNIVCAAILIGNIIYKDIKKKRLKALEQEQLEKQSENC